MEPHRPSGQKPLERFSQNNLATQNRTLAGERQKDAQAPREPLGSPLSAPPQSLVPFCLSNSRFILGGGGLQVEPPACPSPLGQLTVIPISQMEN